MKANREEAITAVSSTVGMKREDLAPIWEEYFYGVVLDDKQLGVLQTHAGWRLESGNHPPGATMPDFSQVIEPGPLKKIDPARVTLAGS
jgi:NitT/TauT family transport system substrate-binding protein